MPKPLAETNNYHAFDIPDDDPSLDSVGWVPPFITTYGMARTLGAMQGSKKWKKAAKIAWKGCAAIDVLTAVIGSCLPLCGLFEKTNLPTYQQQALGDPASRQDVAKWGLFNVLCGISLPAFVKLFNPGELPPAGAAGTTPEATAMQRNTTMHRIAAVNDLWTQFDSDHAVPGTLRELFAQNVTAKLGSNAGTSVVAYLAGLVQDFIGVASKLVGDADRNLPAEGKRNIARLVTRMYMNDLIQAANVAMPGGIGGDRIYEFLETLLKDKVLRRKYQKYREAGLTWTKVPEELGNLVRDVLSVASAQADVAALMLPSISDIPVAARVNYANTRLIQAGQAAQTAAAAEISGVIQTLNGLLVAGFATGRWATGLRDELVAGREAGGEKLAKFSKQYVKLARAKGLLPRMTIDGAEVDLLFYRTIEYDVGDEHLPPKSIIPAPINADNLEAYATALVEYTEFSSKMRKALLELVLTGQITTSTTLAELFGVAGVVGKTATDLSRLPIYNAPFGVTIAFSDKFASNPARYGSSPLVFPPDPASDCQLPAMPGSALRDVLETLRAAINRTDSAAVLSVAERGDDLQFTGPLANFRPFGQQAGTYASASGADTFGCLATVARLALIHGQTFAGSEASRLLGMAIGVTPIDDKETVRAMLDQNVPPPFSVLVARPYITMKTHDIILIKAGRNTGMTILGYDQVAFGKDAGVGVWIVRYHFYAAASIWRPESIGKMRDCVISQVYYGFGDEPIQSDADTPFSGRSERVKDLMFMIGGFYDMRLDRASDPFAIAEGLPNPVSITGDYSGLPIDPHSITEFDRELGVAAYYRHVFPMTFGQTAAVSSIHHRFSISGTNLNPFCFLGEHYYLDPATGSFTGHTYNTGHFGKTATMPGTAACRRGPAGKYPVNMIEQTGLVPSS